MPQPLQVVIIKPSKYLVDCFVERFRRGFMPNSTVPYMRRKAVTFAEREQSLHFFQIRGDLCCGLSC